MLPTWGRPQHVLRDGIDIKEGSKMRTKTEKEAEVHQQEKLEELANVSYARTFYEKLRRRAEDFKTGADSCRPTSP